MTHMKQAILDAVNAIQPLDDLEQEHKDDVLAWVKSGAPLFRISKPDNPPKHLVSYFVLYDPQSSQLMLIDHIKARLWLPTGGHVEIDEDPRTTVSREAYEELRITPKFGTVFGHDPLFVTVTETKGQGAHTDVSLWYVIEGTSTDVLAYDKVEMNSYKWLSLQDVLDTDISELDPHMHRFVAKMQRTIADK
ncbi:MAG TPA: NUDIX domain-containing protein [Candidatus Saccharimonadales bacterium]|nr:NUDIX domain-containing protein [Candidatus Saccharimonadales bacterium]